MQVTRWRWRAGLIWMVCVAGGLRGAGAGVVHYVCGASTGAVSPYLTWATAATNIQDAVTAAEAGDEVVVTNGDYALTAQVTVSEAIVLRSANGLEVTTIRGKAGIRCLQIAAAGARVEGFTIRDGNLSSSGGGVYLQGGTLSNCVVTGCSSPSGSGVYMADGLVTHCVLTGNSRGSYYSGGGGIQMANGTIAWCQISSNSVNGGGGGIRLQNGLVTHCRVFANSNGGDNNRVGGGIYMDAGTVRNCLVYGNWTTGSGAGIYAGGGVVESSTVYGNRTTVGGDGGGIGTSSSYTLRNSVVYYNFGPTPATRNLGGSPAMTYTCSEPLRSGTGNTAADPMLADYRGGDCRLLAGSPCVDTGSTQGWMSGAVDLDGNKRVATGGGTGSADMGAYEMGEGFSVGVAVSHFYGEGVHSNFVLTAQAGGTNRAFAWYGWDVDGDGTWELQGGGLGVITNGYAPGTWTVRFGGTNTAGEGAFVEKSPALRYGPHYVKEGSATALCPYDTWETAASNIHDALAVAWDGCTVVVTDGTYAIAAQLSLTNCVTLRSVGGPDVTTIQGGSGYRCIYVPWAFGTNETIIDGFSITGGNLSGSGGGAYMIRGMMQNCRVVGNHAASGCGIYLVSGTVSNCMVSGNSRGSYSTSGGGLMMLAGLLVDSLVCSNSVNGTGGGLYLLGGQVERCRVFGNSVYGDVVRRAGGAYLADGTVRNSLVHNNTSTSDGAGIQMAGGTLQNCTIARNTISGSGSGGGLYVSGGTVQNCVIWGNTGPYSASHDVYRSGGTLTYNCSDPFLGGTGNIGDDPMFTDASGGDFHLLAGSPCVDRGVTLGWMTLDLDRQDRVMWGNDALVVDMGAYERASGFGVAFAADALVRTAPNSNFVFEASFSGTNQAAAWYGWDFDGDGDYEISGFGDLRVVTNAFMPGTWTVRLVVTNTAGEGTELVRTDYLRFGPHYVWGECPTPLAPFDTWGTAATSVADAVSVAMDGATIRVTNGTYELSAQLTLDRGVTVESVNGADVTTLQGKSGIRCVYIPLHAGTNETVLEGFTVRNGHMSPGAGIYMATGIVRECVIRDNTAGNGGGFGVYLLGGVLRDSTLCGNGGSSWAAQGGGVYCSGGAVFDCVITNNYASGYGGGVYLDSGKVEGCRVLRNRAYGDSNRLGGGMYVVAGSVRNCILAVNTTTSHGGGMYLVGGTVRHCTFVTNRCTSAGTGGGAYMAGGTMENSLLYWNIASASDTRNVRRAGTFRYNGVQPFQDGEENYADDPLFAAIAADDFHLQSKGGRWNGEEWVRDSVLSPAIDAADPEASWDNETENNGDRANGGAYGNTAEASRTPEPVPAGTLLFFR